MNITFKFLSTNNQTNSIYDAWFYHVLSVHIKGKKIKSEKLQNKGDTYDFSCIAFKGEKECSQKPPRNTFYRLEFLRAMEAKIGSNNQSLFLWAMETEHGITKTTTPIQNKLQQTEKNTEQNDIENRHRACLEVRLYCV